MGYFSNYSGPLALIIGLIICSSIIILYIQNFSNIFPSLIIFSLLYEFFISKYSILYYYFITALTNKPATGLQLYSIFEFQHKIRNLIRGSISSILVRDVSIVAKYENLILFISITFLTSSLSNLSYQFFNSYCPRFSGQIKRLS